MAGPGPSPTERLSHAQTSGRRVRLTQSGMLECLCHLAARSSDSRACILLHVQLAKERKINRQESFAFSRGYPIELVGEPLYQDILTSLVPPGDNMRSCWADIRPEEGARSGAIRVEIAGQPVGHLPPETAARFRMVATRLLELKILGRCASAIVDGGRRGAPSPHFGVVLDLNDADDCLAEMESAAQGSGTGRTAQVA